jgi:ribonuclease D
MELLTTTDQLAQACRAFAAEPFVTVDTEFLRETTYWPKLCLLQIAGAERTVLVDALSPGLDLQPAFELMANPAVLKVFHAARQDIEIMWHLASLVPAPVFDTQVAAMVLGFGDQISYDQLVQRLVGAQIDKSHRFTDWSKRPLSEAQLAYAAADVVHLRPVYEKLVARLEKRGRASWVADEMAVLTSPETYRMDPESAWVRLKGRIRKPRELAVLIEVAAWREREAQARNVPRGRVVKDEVIQEVAQRQPRDAQQLGHLRVVPQGFERSRAAEGLLGAVERGLARDPATLPVLAEPRVMPNGSGATVDLLKVLLKRVSEEAGVASKVLATVDELELVAADDEADVPALKGWRRELFGERALKLKRGELSLAIERGRVVFDEREPRVAPASRRQEPAEASPGEEQT